MKRINALIQENHGRETLLTVGLGAAILAVCLLPASQPRAARTGPPVLFQVMESDYLQPKYGSARHVQALNLSAAGALGFAGYDTFRSAVRLPGGNSIARVTRFAGDLFSILGVEFVLRDPPPSGGARVFLSESFWETEFQRDPAVAGLELLVNGEPFRVAGVVREPGPTPIGSTDLWMPVGTRTAMGGSPSLRLIGAADARADWIRAGKLLVRNAGTRWRDLLGEVLQKPAFVPFERVLLFGGPESDREILAVSSSARRRRTI